jgi:hypothetical protein
MKNNPFLSPVTINNKQPLLSKKSYTPATHFNISKLKEFENKFHSCNKNCSILCNKTCFKDFAKFEFEEIKNIDSDFGSKSIIIFLVTLILSIVQYAFYRKFSDLIYNNENTFKYFDNKEILIKKTYDNQSRSNHNFFNDLLFEITFFNWRYQIVVIMLFLYVQVSKFFIKNVYKEERRTNNFDYEKERDKMHLINLPKNLVNYEFMKFSFFNLVSNFLLLISTKALPIGLCLTLFNIAPISNFISKKENRKKRKILKSIIFIIVAFLLLFIFINDKSYGLDKMYERENSQQLHNESSKIPNIGNFLTENEKISTYFNLSDKNEHPKLIKYNVTEEINKSYSINNLNTLFYSFSILSCLSASFISFYITKNQTYQYMSNYSPIEISIISNINSLIITSTFIIIFEFLKSGSISLKIIYWAIEFENNFLLILILGLIGTLNILFSIYSSINLKPFFLKIFKFFEIIFVDIFAMYFLSLYDFPDNYTYYLIIFNFFIALAIVDLSKETKYK